MLSRVVAQWSAFDATCRSEAGVKGKSSRFNATDKAVIICFLQILKPLKVVTERLEGEKVPSISNVLTLLKWPQKKLATDPTPSSSIRVFSPAVSCVRQKMSLVLSEKLQYYLRSSDFWIASALDPRVIVYRIYLQS